MRTRANNKKAYTPLRWRGLAAAGLCLLGASAAQAQQSDLTGIELQATEAGYRAPVDPFRLYIPPAVPVEVLQHLRLELDGVDVTTLVRREGDYAVFESPQPLQPGQHVLRVVEFAPDGRISEVGLWSFDVRQSAAFREASVEGGAELSGSQRVGQHRLTDPPGRSQAQGALGLQGAIADGGWRSTAGADFMYTSQAEQSVHGREFDLSQFLVQTNWRQAQLGLGHQALPGAGLVLDTTQRRGVSAGTWTADQRYGVTGFALRTETITGFNHGLGVGDSDNRTQGFMLQASPWEQNPERLRATATYVDANGTAVGDFEGGVSEVSGGDASSVALDSTLADGRVRLRGEYARSAFDFDGLGVGFGAERDNAYALSGVYAPAVADPEALAWSVGLQHQEIGLWFRSLGNPGLLNDRRLSRLFGDLRYGPLSLGAQIGRESDNVDDDPLRPTVDTDFVATQFNFTPQDAAAEEEGFNPFARPTFGLSLAHARSQDDGVPLDSPALPVDRRSREAGLLAAFAPGRWSWSVSHTVTWSEDLTDVQADTRNTLSTFDLQFPVGQYLMVQPNVQRNVFRDRDQDIDVTDLQAGLALGVVGRETWSARLGYALNRSEASDDSFDVRYTTVTAYADWQVLAPRPNRPGARLFLSGSYYDAEEDAVAFGGQYQVFAGINATLPVATR